MTPNESNELRTNDEPQRILLEASERIKACYPNGTKIEALINARTVRGQVQYAGDGMFAIYDENRTRWNFSPAVHPHRVLP